MKQADVFIQGQGDAWHVRNKDKPRLDPDPVLEAIDHLGIKPKSILEIGCGDGRRLHAMFKQYDGCQVCGVDPSSLAMGTMLKSRTKGINGIVGTATSLPGSDGKFDLVIFGFCLYICDPEDLFRIAMESDRVLQDGGFLAIYDFFSESPNRRDYSHHEGVFSRKMDHARLWLANPAYSMVHQQIFDAEVGTNENFTGADNKLVVSVLKKDLEAGFPLMETVNG